MGLLSRLFGGNDEPEQEPRPQQRRAAATVRPAQSDDERAVERYRYLLRTAPPETIEQAHAEAFGQLTPEQRRLVLQELTTDLPEAERAAAARSGDDPNALARMATRAEMRRPGTLERSFGGGGMGMGGGMSMGGLMAGSLLSSIAGVVVGSAIANAFFADNGDGQDSGDGSESGEGEAGAEDAGAESGNAGADAGADAGGDFGGGDLGGDLGGGFGDFGGGDFGGDF